jgi:hypothetical protein
LDAFISKDLKPDLLSYLAALQRSVLIDDWRAKQIEPDILVSSKVHQEDPPFRTSARTTLGFNAAFSACRGQPCAKLLFDDMGSELLMIFAQICMGALQDKHGPWRYPTVL